MKIPPGGSCVLQMMLASLPAVSTESSNKSFWINWGLIVTIKSWYPPQNWTYQNFIPLRWLWYTTNKNTDNIITLNSIQIYLVQTNLVDSNTGNSNITSSNTEVTEVTEEQVTENISNSKMVK